MKSSSPSLPNVELPASRHSLRAIVITAAVAAACRTPAARLDSSRCFQTGELANYGCAEAHGRIVDALGRPVAGAIVAARRVAWDSLGGVDGFGARTDSAGWYAARVVRWLGPPLVGDTAVVCIRAAFAPPPPAREPGTGHSAGDTLWLRSDTGSATVTVRFSPVGALPLRTEVPLIVLHRGPPQPR